MLTPTELSLLCQHLDLSSQAQAILAHIRSSPPSRRVGSGGKNVPVRYPSRKMGMIIQAESRTNELAGVYGMEHDPAVFEFFDQPPSIKLQYQAKNGRKVGVLHTPDYFVIRADSVGWEEWKVEEELVRLADKMPHRYIRGEDGQWHCPPGEAVAAPLGLYYRVRSSASIHWIVQRNLRFLSYYLREDDPRISESAREEVISLVTSNPGIFLAMVLKRVEKATSDDIYTLLAREQIYADLHAAPLAEPERVHLFSNEETAQAWAVTLADRSSSLVDRPHSILIQSGAPVLWDGRTWTIVNAGTTTTTLLSEESVIIELPNGRFQTLVTQGKIVGLTETPEQGGLSQEVRERLMKAGKAALQEAYRRYTIIKPGLSGQRLTTSAVPERTIRMWKAHYREAEQSFGCGYVGLLPKIHQRGNRQPRYTEQTITILHEFIEHEYEQHKQKNKREVYGEFVNFCRDKGLSTIPSYKTFVAQVNHRPRYEQVTKRAGRRAAYCSVP